MAAMTLRAASLPHPLLSRHRSLTNRQEERIAGALGGSKNAAAMAMASNRSQNPPSDNSSPATRTTGPASPPQSLSSDSLSNMKRSESGSAPASWIKRATSGGVGLHSRTRSGSTFTLGDSIDADWLADMDGVDRVVEAESSMAHVSMVRVQVNVQTADLYADCRPF